MPCPARDDPEYLNVLEKLCDGDQSAFVRLVEWHQAELLSFLASRISDPEDVAQEVWITVKHSCQQFGQEGKARNFRAWLYTIARHRLIDEQRKRSRRPEQTSDDPWGNVVDQTEDSSQLESMARREELAIYRKCLETVGGDFVRAIQLQLAGVSTKEIARKDGVTEGTVYTRLYRGKKQLKDCVERKKNP